MVYVFFYDFINQIRWKNDSLVKDSRALVARSFFLNLAKVIFCIWMLRCPPLITSLISASIASRYNHKQLKYWSEHDFGCLWFVWTLSIKHKSILNDLKDTKYFDINTLKMRSVKLEITNHDEFRCHSKHLYYILNVVIFIVSFFSLLYV